MPLRDASSDVSGDEATRPSSDAQVDAPADGQGVVSTDAAIDAPYAVCFGSGGTRSTSLKACLTSGDCTYFRHTINCCGSVELMGIAKVKAAQAASCEASWDSHFPPCGCFSSSVVTEDGKSDADGAAPLVQCVPIDSGSFCQTYL